MIFVSFRFQLLDCLEEGGYGAVYKAYDDITKDNVAIKVNTASSTYAVKREMQFYACLEGVEGVPKILWHGKHKGKYYIAMELLGKDLVDVSNKRWPVRDVMMFAVRAIHILEKIHEKNVLHQDIKPENFLIGRQDKNRIYLVDFGMSRRYIKKGKHKTHVGEYGHVGTAVFAPLSSHRDMPLGRKDDLESLGYVLLSLLNIRLPWESAKIEDNTFDKIYQLKSSMAIEDMFRGRPAVFTKYMCYCRSLELQDKPDYDYLKYLFKEALTSLSFVDDGHFDVTA